MRQDKVYKMIEEIVINQLENGIIPWRRCYNVSGGNVCVSHQTGKSYSLINQIILDDPGEYWTFENVTRAGLYLRKGCKARKVVFWKMLSFENGEETERDVGEISSGNQVPFLKYHNVFHERDVVGLPAKGAPLLAPEERERRNAESIREADAIIDDYLSANKEITMKTADRVPCFVPSVNTIYIPEKSQFSKIEEYYNTAFHEMIHSTAGFVNRQFGNTNEMRAKEELVAEIGAAYLCGSCGITQKDVIENSASYCSNWLKVLSNNVKLLVWASSRAEKAAKYILNEENNQTVEG